VRTDRGSAIRACAAACVSTHQSARTRLVLGVLGRLDVPDRILADRPVVVSRPTWKTA